MTREMADEPMPETRLPASPEADPGLARPETGEGRVVRSEELFAGHRVVLIQHGGEQYRLLITRNDRLILQK